MQMFWTPPLILISNAQSNSFANLISISTVLLRLQTVTETDLKSCCRQCTVYYFVIYVFFCSCVGSHRISDSEISDYDCEDGVGVVSGDHTTKKSTDLCHFFIQILV